MFTKLIVHHLQNKHKFHPRLDSPLHFPYEEHILGYLKFSDNETKREVFGIPILNELITIDIQDSEALAAAGFMTGAALGAEGLDFLVALAGLGAGESRSLPFSQTQEKKRKLVMETSDEPSLVKALNRASQEHAGNPRKFDWWKEHGAKSMAVKLGLGEQDYWTAMMTL
nr:hypothetical protein [Tanacetum cinerariifolium]